MQKRDGYELVDELCPKLCAEYPMEILGVLHRCICKTVQKNHGKSYILFQQLEYSTLLMQIAM